MCADLVLDQRSELSLHKSCCKYTTDVCDGIKWVYIVAIIIWIIIIICLKLYTVNIGLIVIAIPFIVFVIAIYNVHELSLEVEEELFNAAVLSIGLIITLPLLTWMEKKYPGDKSHFSLLIIVALILSLLTLIDVWIPHCWISIEHHIRSALQTMSITLFIYALIMYYLVTVGKI